jgi:small-conductance mechanosensitive channel
MKASERALLIGLLSLLVAAAAGLLLTRPLPPAGAAGAESAARRAAQNRTVVDQSPLETAEQLATSAGTAQERQFARIAVGLADHEVDLAFTQALRDAVTHPPPLSPRALQMAVRVRNLEAAVASDKNETARLTAQAAHASVARQEQLSMQLGLAQAQAGLDADELTDAQGDLARAGGDPQGDIRRVMAEHESSEAHTSSNASGSAGAAEPVPLFASLPIAPAHTIAALVSSWNQIGNTEKQLRQAQQNALALAAALTHDHEQLEAEVTREKPQLSALNRQAAQALSGKGQQDAQAAASEALQSARNLTQDQQQLAGFDERIEAMQHVATVYGRWTDEVAARRRATLHELLWSVALALLIALAAVAGEILLSRMFARIEPERKRLRTLRGVVRFSVRAGALLIILLVIFGAPSQLATVLALAGAGLAVALQDFIMGFFGWFVLFGRNGIRVGDWVEIDGISGEVLEVDLFRTTLLETGDWSDASHPTGRRVSFNNRFAIEGHYFNFSTTGRWFWDELQVTVPFGTDPFSLAEDIRKLATRETEVNARQAQQDWQRVSGAHQERFSAAPVVAVRPDPQGAVISVRYLSRADERYTLSAALYRQIVEMLQARRIPQLVQTAAPAPASD